MGIDVDDEDVVEVALVGLLARAGELLAAVGPVVDRGKGAFEAFQRVHARYSFSPVSAGSPAAAASRCGLAGGLVQPSSGRARFDHIARSNRLRSTARRSSLTVTATSVGVSTPGPATGGKWRCSSSTLRA